MGQQKQYIASGGFTVYLYYQVGDTIVASNGVAGKVVRKIDQSSYDGLPILSNTSEVYFKINSQGEIIQARIYKDRKPVCDFDWDHPHINGNGESFPEGIVHVQLFNKNKNGIWIRDGKHARYMSPEEISRYGELLKKANPNVKLTP
jgi:hypothetical protein